MFAIMKPNKDQQMNRVNLAPKRRTGTRILLLWVALVLRVRFRPLFACFAIGLIRAGGCFRTLQSFRV